MGRISNYHYERVTDLRAQCIHFEVIPAQTQADFDYSSRGAVSIVTKIAGEVPAGGSAIAQANAGITVKFGRAEAVAFRAVGCRSAQIKDRAVLEEEICSRYRTGLWPEEWVVIVEAVSALSATILISNASNAQIDLLATGNVGVRGLDLASVGANFQVVNESSVAVKIVASQELTPLFKAAAIRKRLLRPDIFRDAHGNDKEVVLGRVDYDDFADV